MLKGDLSVIVELRHPDNYQTICHAATGLHPVYEEEEQRPHKSTSIIFKFADFEHSRHAAFVLSPYRSL